MIRINEIKQLGLSITWKLLYIGFSKKEIFGQQFYLEDIIEYAIEQIELGEENQLVYELISIYEYETSLCSDILYELSEKENSNYEIEFRKIRVVIIYNSIITKNDDYIDGIYNLYDLYFKLGKPEDIPIIIQGVNNGIRAEEYYTEKTYEHIYNEIKNWVEHELKILKKYNF